MPKKVVLATIGSLGDVHPFIALGLALKARGADVVLAAPKSNLAKIERAGLRAEAIFPTFEEMGAALGMSEKEATDRMLRNQDFLIRRLIIRYLPESAKALDRLCQGASAIVSSMFALGAPIIAEARGVPLIPVVLQPMTMMSPHDPPLTPDFWFLRPPPVTAGRLAWNRLFLKLVSLELKRRYAGPIDAVRRSYGLPPSPLAPVFPGPPAQAGLVVALYPDAFAARPADIPSNVACTGFPIFDSDSGAPETLAPEVKAFLSAGEAPLVFTLGSFAVYSPGDFYRQSLAAARKLKRRAILLTGPACVVPAPDALVCAYEPHSLIFPHAAAIIHHGGVGTTGAALRSGRPQLIVPHMGDQADHAARIVRLGVGGSLAARRYSADRAVQALRRILDDPGIAQAARSLAPRFAANGADAAAEAVMRVLA